MFIGEYLERHFTDSFADMNEDDKRNLQIGKIGLKLHSNTNTVTPKPRIPNLKKKKLTLRNRRTHGTHVDRFHLKQSICK